jgi:hypothetical protein
MARRPLPASMAVAEGRPNISNARQHPVPPSMLRLDFQLECCLRAQYD